MKRSSALAALGVFVVACVVYARTAGYDFTYDDVAIIKDRTLFHSLANWRQILVAPWWPDALYRPFAAFTMVANWQAGGGDPRPFHLVNIALHGAASVLVFYLARTMLGIGAAAVAALLFAVHPVHVEAVANVVGRLEVLATGFAVAAVLCYRADGVLAADGDHTSWRRYGATFGTLLFTLMALASKESAFALPCLLLAADLLTSSVRETSFEKVFRGHRLLWVASVVVALGWLVLRARVVSDLTGLEVAPGLEELGLMGRAVVMLPIVLQYARLLFFPARLSVDYSPDFIVPASSITGSGLLGLALVLAAAATAIVVRRRAPAVTFAIIWMAATIFIVANIIAPTGVLLAERTLYFPSVGAVILAGWGWQVLSARASSVAVVAAALLVVLGATRTMSRNPVWRSNDALYRQLSRDAPESYRALAVDGMLAAQAGDTRRGEALLRRSIGVHPLAAWVWRHLGNLVHDQGRYAEAGTYFWTAWRVDHSRRLDAERAVQDALRAGAFDTAEARLNEAAKVWPDSVEIRIAAGDVALARGKPLKAMTLRRQLAWDNPGLPELWMLTADAAFQAGYCPELLRSARRLKVLEPNAEELPRLEAGAGRLGCDQPGRAVPTLP